MEEAGKKSGNYQSDIHDTGYEREYLDIMLNSGGLINIAGRETESLNGQWNFAPDLYDTCRRAKWYRDIQTNAAGAPQPPDWDWEGWERITVPASWDTERPELF